MITSFEQLDFRKIVQFANHLYDERNTDVLFNSLHEGAGGVLMLNYSVGKFLNDSFLLNKADCIYENIINNVSQGKIYDSVSFANGLPGLCWLLKYYAKLTNKTFTIAPEVDQLIKISSIKAFDQGYPDPLYGGMGGLYYFIKKDRKYNKDIDDIFRAFYRNGKNDNRGFRTRNYLLKENKENEYDLGFAHGLAGYISILSIIESPEIDVNICIKKALQYIEKQYCPKVLSKFPASVFESNPTDMSLEERYNIRIGWCYGDLSIATMYMHLYKKTRNPIYYEKSIDLVKCSLARNTPELSHINDIYFCHGSSYLYYIYDVFYTISHEECFYRQSRHWLEYTLKNVDINKELNKSALSFLNGIIGTLLTWFCVEKQIIHKDFFQAYFLNI